MNELIGSVSVEDFIRGVLQVSTTNTLGSIWEKCVTCDHCLFKTKCHQLGDIMDEQGKNPTCGQMFDLLMGELDPDTIPIQTF